VIEAPEDLRDAVWTAATLTLANGGEVVALVPTRYADTPAQGSDAEKLSRATNWVDAGGETFVGVGQRLFATDQEDVALLDVRELILNPAPEETAQDG
jgi:type VI secretion system protein ImpE